MDATKVSESTAITDLGLPIKLVEQIHRLDIHNVGSLFKKPHAPGPEEFRFIVRKALEEADLQILQACLVKGGIEMVEQLPAWVVPQVV